MEKTGANLVKYALNKGKEKLRGKKREDFPIESKFEQFNKNMNIMIEKGIARENRKEQEKDPKI